MSQDHCGGTPSSSWTAGIWRETIKNGDRVDRFMASHQQQDYNIFSVVEEKHFCW